MLTKKLAVVIALAVLALLCPAAYADGGAAPAPKPSENSLAAKESAAGQAASDSLNELFGTQSQAKAANPVVRAAYRPPLSNGAYGNRAFTSTTTSATPQTGRAGSTPESELVWFPFYLWLPGMDGTVGAKGQTAPVNASPLDILEDFRFGYMTEVRYRRGRLVVGTDFILTRLADSVDTPFGLLFASSDVKVTEVIIQPEVAVRVLQGEHGGLDFGVGFRFWYVGMDIDLEPGLLPAVSVDDSQTWFEPVIGTKFRVNVAEKWYLAGLADIGGFGAGTRLSWQAMVGVGRDFKEKYTMYFGYRHLDVDREHNGATLDVGMGGLIFGIGMKLSK